MTRHARKIRPLQRFGQQGSVGLVAAIVLSLVVAGVAGTALGGPLMREDCPGGVRVLDVAVTPEMAPVVTEAADAAARDEDRCWRAKVTARPSADVLDDLRRDGGQVDVWVPDSSIWVRLASKAGVGIASQAGPVATSPVVLAIPSAAARGLGWPDRELDAAGVLHTGGSSHPVAIGWPDPKRSAPAIAGLLGLERAASRRASGRIDLTGLMRSAIMGIDPQTDQALGDGVLTVPVAEQSVWAYNATSAEPLVAAYSRAPGSSLDYPLVVTDGAPATTRDAADLLAALSSKSARLLLQSRGFRDRAGRAGPALREVEGIDASAAVSVRTPSMDDLSTARTMLGTLGRGSRILAVVDVSGSMAEQVPGSRLTRLELTIEAASAGLSLLPARSEAGLWEFSTDLGPETDYRELVPIGAVTGGHAKALARRLAGLRPIPNGSTGLYDTVLAAVRRVRSDYDTTRTNAVVLLTDGHNQDPHGLRLAGLLDRLRAEQDPSRPVPVIAVAYGPDSDAASLRAISDVTGGATYVSADPRRIRSVLLDAIGQRLCRPDCAPAG
jgi:Ca-activated chloride channel family protein